VHSCHGGKHGDFRHQTDRPVAVSHGILYAHGDHHACIPYDDPHAHTNANSYAIAPYGHVYAYGDGHTHLHTYADEHSNGYAHRHPDG
jgi:hypothetical protein